jgi:hypothetical protein
MLSKKLSWRCRKLYGSWRSVSFLKRCASSNACFIFVSVLAQSQMVSVQIRRDIAEERGLTTFRSFINARKFWNSESFEELSRASSAYVTHYSVIACNSVFDREISSSILTSLPRFRFIVHNIRQFLQSHLSSACAQCSLVNSEISQRFSGIF